MVSSFFACGSIGVASLLAAMMATSAEGHTMSVCTSTGGTGSTCGTLKFIMTTYHSYNEGGGTPPGTLYIKDPTGRTLTYAFSSGCTFQTPDSDGCSSKLAGYNGCDIPADADISCYYAAVSGSDKFVGVKGDETCKANGYPGQWYNAAYIADVPSATTGTYELWTTGTDQQLDPCSLAGQACKLQQNHHITIDIAVANCGDPCQPFTDVSISGTTAGSNQPYTAAVGSCSANFDGAICSDVSCSGGFQPSGNLKCVDGVIENNFVCVDPAFQYYCSDAVDCSAHGTTSDEDNRDGCECLCDAGYTGYNCGVLMPTTTITATTTTTPTTTTITTSATTTATTTSTTTKTTTTSTTCVNIPLSVEWSSGGVWDCDYYQNRYGREWCRHEYINSHCCYCRIEIWPLIEDRTLSTTKSFLSPTTTSTTLCVDSPLPAQWSGGGQWSCAFYQERYGQAYCLHQAINSACCYCRNSV